MKKALILLVLPLPLLMARGGESHAAAENHPAAEGVRTNLEPNRNPNYGDYGYSDPNYVPTPPPTPAQTFPQSPQSDNFFDDPNWPNTKSGSTYNNKPN